LKAAAAEAETAKLRREVERLKASEQERAEEAHRFRRAAAKAGRKAAKAAKAAAAAVYKCSYVLCRNKNVLHRDPTSSRTARVAVFAVFQKITSKII
jgi:hypothetical protein